MGASASEDTPGVAVAACAGAVVAAAAGTAVGGTDVAAGADVGGTEVAGTDVAGVDVGVAASPQAAATMTNTRNMLKTPKAILCFLAPRKVRFDTSINFIAS